MQITSATFTKGVTTIEQMFEDNLPRVALIGRSNVGKSTTVNILTKQKTLAKVSSTPGRTQQLNYFLINNKWHLVDLPGYGYAKGSASMRNAMKDLIGSYLFTPGHEHAKVVQIIDAVVGPTELDLDILRALEKVGKKVVVVANKIDKVNKSGLQAKLKEIQYLVGVHPVIPYSAEKKIGIAALMDAIDPFV